MSKINTVNIVNIVDAIMGIGKTTAAINMINKSVDKKFIYITPYLTEVQRIKEECSQKKFREPKVISNTGSKKDGLKKLISKGENIVTTHALFRFFDEEIIEMLYYQNYNLVMDEVTDVVEILEITNDDMETLLEKYTTIQEDGSLIWTASEYRGEFEHYKRLCELGCLCIYGANSAQKIILLWMFPITVFQAFKDVYILTYLFNAQIQKYYYDYYNIGYNYLYVKDYELTSEPQEYSLKEFRSLINICENDKLNRVGDKYFNLSRSWLEKLKKHTLDKNGNIIYNDEGIEKKSEVYQIIKNNCVNYFQHIVKTSSNENMWTTFKEFRGQLKGKGYSKGFVSMNMRATNDYRHKVSIAYLANRYYNPIVKNFFSRKGIQVNEDLFALSELTQFIFRSQIRDKKPINIYIPSSRMRNLLKDWLHNL